MDNENVFIIGGIEVPAGDPNTPYETTPQEGGVVEEIEIGGEATTKTPQNPPTYVTNYMEGYYNVTRIEDDDLESSIQLGQKADLKCSLVIMPNNLMEVIAEVEMPPKIVANFSPIKDTFVRSGYNTLNYGGYNDIFVGVSSRGEVFRSLLQFDISTLPKSKTIYSAHLKLYQLSYGIDVPMIIKENIQEWSEFGTTWLNRPYTTEQFMDALVISRDGYISLDLTPIVEGWYNGEANHGITIKAKHENTDNLREFYSREGSYKPILEVVYYDPNVYSYNETNLPSNVEVGAGDNLESSLEVNPTWRTDDLESSLTTIQRYKLPSSIIVNKDKLDAEMYVPYSSDMPGSLIIQHKDMSEMSGSLYVNRPSLPSSVFVAFHDSLESSLVITKWADNTLRSSLKVNQRNLDSYIQVTSSGDLHGTLTPKVNSSADLESELLVRNPRVDDLESVLGVNRAKLPTEIEVTHSNDLDSKINISLPRIDDLESVLGVSKDKLPTKIEVTHSSDLDSNIHVSLPRSDDVPSVVGVSRDNVPSKIEVTFSSDLPSYLEVNKIADLPSRVIVAHPGQDNLNSCIDVMTADDLESSLYVKSQNILGQLIVRVHRDNDLESSLIGRANRKDDLEAKLLPRVHRESDLPSSGVIYKIGQHDIPSNITPKVLRASEIESELDVINRNDLGSSVRAKVVRNSDISSTLIVYRNGTDDLEATLKIQYNSDLPASLVIPATNKMEGVGNIMGADKSDLESSLEILNSYPYAYIM